MTRRTSLFLAVLAAVVLAVGCAGQKEPATKAIADAETALAAVKDDAAKYAGDDLATVEAQLAGLKESLAKGDYKAVVTGAPALVTAIGSLQKAAESKKAEVMAAMEKAKADFGPLSDDVGKMIGALQSRIDILSKAKKLPQGLDATKFDGAKASFEAAKAAMADATAAATSGDFIAAMAKGQEAKAKGTEALTALGMPTA